MFYQINSYIKFLFQSTNAHGVHSPFVYSLLTKCFYDKTSYEEYSILKRYRSKVFSDHSFIEMTDFGEGSRVFKSNRRKISDIAKVAGIGWRRQKLLFRLSKYFDGDQTLELGTSLGLATAALALGNKNANITSVEACSETAKKAKSFFQDNDLNNIELRAQKFEEYFLKENLPKFDFIYVDGSHSKAKTLEYFNIILQHIHKDSIVIFDDIYWSKSMTEAWREIVSHPQVSVSIDTFKWGIIFFRKEQRKEHFLVRI